MWAWGLQPCSQRSANAALQRAHNARCPLPALRLCVGLGFSIGSGQNTAVVALLGCEPHKWGAPGLWVSGGLFRHKGWRMMGSTWGMRVCLLSPRGGIAAGSPGYSLPDASCAPPSALGLLQVCVLGSCCMGGLVCGFYETEGPSKLLVYLCWIPFGLRVIPALLLHSRGAPMPGCC